MKSSGRMWLRVLLLVGLGVCLSFGQSQPPIPAKGAGGNAPQQQAKQEQTPSQTNGTFTDNSTTFLKVVVSPKDEKKPSKEKDEDKNKPATDWWMFGVTVVLVLIGGGQCFIYYCQWEAMKQQLADARNSSDAASADAKSQLTIMQDTVNEAKKSSEAQLRAYICVCMDKSAGKIVRTPLGDGHFIFTGYLKIKNFGQTPAHNVICKPMAQILDKPILDTYVFPIPSSARVIDEQQFLGPGQRVFMSAFTQAIKLSEHECESIIHGSSGRALYLWGEIDYKDVFGVPRKLNYCVGVHRQSSAAYFTVSPLPNRNSST